MKNLTDKEKELIISEVFSGKEEDRLSPETQIAIDEFVADFRKRVKGTIWEYKMLTGEKW